MGVAESEKGVALVRLQQEDCVLIFREGESPRLVVHHEDDSECASNSVCLAVALISATTNAELMKQIWDNFEKRIREAEEENGFHDEDEKKDEGGKEGTNSNSKAPGLSS